MINFNGSHMFKNGERFGYVSIKNTLAKMKILTYSNKLGTWPGVCEMQWRLTDLDWVWNDFQRNWSEDFDWMWGVREIIKNVTRFYDYIKVPFTEQEKHTEDNMTQVKWAYIWLYWCEVCLHITFLFFGKLLKYINTECFLSLQNFWRWINF